MTQHVDYEIIEETILEKTNDFAARMEEISLRPVTSEADVEGVTDELDALISDMQAFSNSLTEGHQRGSIRGAGLAGAHLEISKAAYAPGSKGEAAAAAA